MGTDAEDRNTAKKYVAAKINGLEPREAARVAGYSDKTKIKQIERVGGPVDNLMSKALEEKGITEEFIANEYAEGIALSKSEDASKADCNAHAKYLLQLGYLKGYGRGGPSVAVQINNNTRSDTPDAGERIADTLQEVRELLAVVREEISTRDITGISGEDTAMAGGDSVCPDTGPHQRVVDVGGEP